MLSSFYQLTIWVVTVKVFDDPLSLVWRCSVSFVNVNFFTSDIDRDEILIFNFFSIFSVLFTLNLKVCFIPGSRLLFY